MNATICVTHTFSYQQDEVTKSVKRHFGLLDLKSIIKPDMRVLLKPNLLMKRKPEEITTTHPAVIAGIIICLKELGVTDITLADSPGGPFTRQSLKGIYDATGMTALANEFKIKLNDDYTFFERKSKNAKLVQKFNLITPVKNADFIIDIAKLKTHSMTTLSGGVKNLFGTVPGLMKPEFHFRFPDKDDFSNMLLDLCETVKPNVTFVDAVISMEGDGPSGGTPKQSNMIISAENPYNLDLLLCDVININPSEVCTVSNAIKRRLCVERSDKLNVIGDGLYEVDDFKKPNVTGVDFLTKMPKWFSKVISPLATRLLVSKPHIRKKDCIGCGKCAESCPAKTINIVDRKAIINYNECIKCFCCHEMCPVKAIDIKRFKLFNL